MWKPGSSPPTETDQTRFKKHRDGSKDSVQLRTKHLSGSTMNMRFMQRTKTALPLSNAPVEHDTSPNNDIESNSNNDKKQILPRAAMTHEMYSETRILGRRSFGGFNPSMEDAWKESYRSYRNESPGKKTKALSDQELLDRYEQLVQRRGKQDLAIGNLPQKVNLRKRKSRS